MARAALELLRLWSLGDDQAAALLCLPASSYLRWKEGEIDDINHDTRERLSHLMGIHKALRIIFKQPQRAYGWIQEPNTAFGGISALQVMLGGQLSDLLRVRRLLEAEGA